MNYQSIVFNSPANEAIIDFALIVTSDLREKRCISGLT